MAPRTRQYGHHRRAASGCGHADLHAYTFNIEDRTAIAGLAQRLLADHLTLNVRVNNAGIMRSEALDRARDPTDAHATVATNLVGPILLIDALIDYLATRSDASVINSSSGLAFVPSVGASVFAATKAAIHSSTVSLWIALKGKVEVIGLVPLAVQTGLTPGPADAGGPHAGRRFHR